MSVFKSSNKRNKRILNTAATTTPAAAMAETTTYVTGIHGGAVRRIRSPHEHDVLSGRGGGINSHVGNQHFREWVAVRKNDYNLAPSKNDKARVAREVIALVEAQNPPGKFLQKDQTAVGSSSAWWVELDDDRVMAKTSQALREGAPSIRAAHKHDLPGGRSNKPRNSRKRTAGAKRAYELTTSQEDAGVATRQERTQAMLELRANVDASRHEKEVKEEEDDVFEQPGKRVRVDYKGHTLYPTDATPPLHSIRAPNGVEPLRLTVLPPPADFPPMPLQPRQSSNSTDAEGLKRAHSLALSDFSLGEFNDEEFVNPFEDEGEFDWKRSTAAPKAGVAREASTASNGDMGGIGALMRSESSNKSNSSATSSGVRSRNSLGNVSSRYEGSTDPLPFGDHGWSSTPSIWWGLEETWPAPVSPERER